LVNSLNKPVVRHSRGGTQQRQEATTSVGGELRDAAQLLLVLEVSTARVSVRWPPSIPSSISLVLVRCRPPPTQAPSSDAGTQEPARPLGATTGSYGELRGASARVCVRACVRPRRITRALAWLRLCDKNNKRVSRDGGCPLSRAGACKNRAE
jgi:hypothetical protein